LLKLGQMRNRDAAGAAPGGPKLDDIHLAVFKLFDGLAFHPFRGNDGGRLVGHHQRERTRTQATALGRGQRSAGQGGKRKYPSYVPHDLLNAEEATFGFIKTSEWWIVNGYLNGPIAVVLTESFASTLPASSRTPLPVTAFTFPIVSSTGI